MLVVLKALMSQLYRQPHEPVPDIPPARCRWAIDLPTIEGKRLGVFHTKEDALDARREYIIRTLRENSTPVELPF